MKHLDEATLTTLRDRETQDPVALDHLATCDRCATALAEVEKREAFIAQALATIDEDGLGLEAAKARVRARLDQRRTRDARARAWWWPRHMGRAAAVLLVAAGAVSALPGSPVRQWLTQPAPEAARAGVAAAASTQEVLPAGIEVTVPPSGLRVQISPVGPLDGVEVAWSDGPVATVEAPAGSRFSYAEGRLEAVVAGGPVRVVLPRSGPRVAVEVDGRPYLVRSDEGTEVTGPVGDRSDERIRFLGPS